MPTIDDYLVSDTNWYAEIPQKPIKYPLRINKFTNELINPKKYIKNKYPNISKRDKQLVIKKYRNYKNSTKFYNDLIHITMLRIAGQW